MRPLGIASHQRLETLTNICILVFLVIVGGAYIKAQLSPRPSVSQIKIGDQLPSLAGYDWNSHPRTLVLALRYGCHWCEDSAPFYKRLIELERSGQIKDVHIVAVFPDDTVVALRTLQLAGLNLNYIPSVRFPDYRISATPTLILTDENGRVLQAWRGRLPTSEEQRIIEILGMESKR